MTALEEAFAESVAAVVQQVLEPYLPRLADPEPLVYSLRECAKVLGTSVDTVCRLIDDGVLPIVPHMGKRKVIPRVAVQALVQSQWKQAAS